MPAIFLLAHSAGILVPQNMHAQTPMLRKALGGKGNREGTDKMEAHELQHELVWFPAPPLLVV